MAVAVGNKDVSYIVANGKTVRQIIRGNNNTKENIPISDCKYIYLGASRTKLPWKTFHFNTEQWALKNVYVDIHDYISSSQTTIEKNGVCGYSYYFRGSLDKSNAGIILFSMQGYGAYSGVLQLGWFVDYTSNPYTYILNIIIPARDGSYYTVYSQDFSQVDAITEISVNLYATSGYVYENTNVIPNLYIDIIVWFKLGTSRAYTQKHIVYSYDNNSGTCADLSQFFSERDKKTKFLLTSRIEDLSPEVSRMNIFRWLQE